MDKEQVKDLLQSCNDIEAYLIGDMNTGGEELAVIGCIRIRLEKLLEEL